MACSLVCMPDTKTRLKFRLLDGLESSLYLLKCGCVSEAEVALALRAEDYARNGCGVGAVEQDFGGFAAVLADVGAAGEGVEGAGWRLTFESEAEQPRDEQVAAFAVVSKAIGFKLFRH